MDYQVVSLAERPELPQPALELHAVGWPEFLQHDPAAPDYEARLASELAGFQVLVFDEKGELAAAGVSIPFAWDGTREGLRPAGTPWSPRGLRDLDQGRPRRPHPQQPNKVLREGPAVGLAGSDNARHGHGACDDQAVRHVIQEPPFRSTGPS